MTTSDTYRMTAEQVIECAIGLFDDRDVPRGKRPPVLARHILDELAQHGYDIQSLPPDCRSCGERHPGHRLSCPIGGPI